MGELRTFAEFRDETGESVGKLLATLVPHFLKENAMVMPVLGSLKALASDEKVNLREIADFNESILNEYDNMYQEHAGIRKLIFQTTEVAKREHHDEVVQLLEGLAHHARVEEQVLYPAALLACKFAMMRK